MGYSVNRVRLAATVAGGFLAGIGGAFLSLYYPGSWNEGLSSGQGLMAVALVIFARWSPLRCVGAALLFGAAGALGPALQSVGVSQGYYLFNAAPYVLTLLIMIVTLSPRQRRCAAARASCRRTQMSEDSAMSGLGGLNKSPNGVVIGLVQLQLPVVATPARPRRADRRASSPWSARPGATCRRMDLVVFPEYALHGLSMDTDPSIMCRLDGPEVAAFRRRLREQPDLGLLLDHGAEPRRQSVQQRHHHRRPAASSRLYYRKLHPWVPVEPWEPGDLGIPVCDGPNGSKLGADHLPRRHVPGDGARVRLQGRRDHDAHRRLHRADPPRLAASPTRPTRSAT